MALLIDESTNRVLIPGVRLSRPRHRYRLAKPALVICRCPRDDPRQDHRSVLRQALQYQRLAGRAIATELADLRGGTIWIHLMQFGLAPGLRYKLGELRRQLGALRPFPAAASQS